MAYHGVLNTVPCAIRALFICLIYNSLHLLTPNWTDLTLSYSPTTTFKEESLNSLPSVSHHVPKDKGLQWQSPLDLTFCLLLHIVIHSVTCLFFGKITLATVSSINSPGCQSPSHTFCLHPGLLFDSPQSSALLSTHNSLPFSGLLSHNCTTNYLLQQECLTCRLWKCLVLFYLWAFTYSCLASTTLLQLVKESKYYSHAKTNLYPILALY